VCQNSATVKIEVIYEKQQLISEIVSSKKNYYPASSGFATLRSSKSEVDLKF